MTDHPTNADDQPDYGQIANDAMAVAWQALQAWIKSPPSHINIAQMRAELIKLREYMPQTVPAPTPGLVAELFALAEDMAADLTRMHNIGDRADHLAYIKMMLPLRPDHTGELLDIALTLCANLKDYFSPSQEDQRQKVVVALNRLTAIRDETAGPAVTRHIGPFEEELIAMLESTLQAWLDQSYGIDLFNEDRAATINRLGEIKAARAAQ
jgi:hypothetical protein